jgi:hypothetical protein
MSGRERIKRPEPERTGPIRNWSTLFGPPKGAAPPPFPGFPGPGDMPFPFPGVNGAHFPFPGVNGASFPFPGVNGAPQGPSDVVSRGVATGYRVIEEYMRQGQNVARTIWGGAGGSGGGAAFSGLPGMEDPQQRMEGMARYATQMASLWMDMMSLVIPGALGAYAPPPAGTAGPFSMGGDPPRAPSPQAARAAPAAPWPGAAPAAASPPVATAPIDARGGEPTAVVVEVESSRPTEISLDLRPRSLGLALRIHDLRAPEADKPRLEHVTIAADAEQERVKVSVRVPEGQPAGVYSGIILDERTSLPRGTLTVRIG